MSDHTIKPGRPAQPPDNQRDQLTGHNYDGIQEYDNPTPGWWVWIFAASAVFAAFYFLYYEGPSPDRTIADSYGDSVAAYQKKKLDMLGVKELNVTEPNMLKWMANPGYMEYGRAVFKQNCTSCHGDNGQGLVGPNMTDDYYKNVTRLTDIPRVITEGANNGAMPSWARLGSVDIGLVGAYVATLRGKNLPSPKPAYGVVIPPWPPLPAPETAPAASANTPAAK